jgi:hypothetical protein
MNCTVRVPVYNRISPNVVGLRALNQRENLPWRTVIQRPKRGLLPKPGEGLSIFG